MATLFYDDFEDGQTTGWVPSAKGGGGDPVLSVGQPPIPKSGQMAMRMDIAYIGTSGSYRYAYKMISPSTDTIKTEAWIYMADNTAATPLRLSFSLLNIGAQHVGHFYGFYNSNGTFDWTMQETQEVVRVNTGGSWFKIEILTNKSTGEWTTNMYDSAGYFIHSDSGTRDMSGISDSGWHATYGFAVYSGASYHVWVDAVTSADDYVTPPPPDLVANFSASATSGVAPLTVSFTDLSTGNPTSWLWDFGDGGTSTARNPIYTYTTAGLYTVLLTATRNGTSDTETKVAYVSVSEPIPDVEADFTADVTSGYIPLQVTFSDLSTGSPTSWYWQFGDGSASTLQNPSHTYTSAGVYDVSLTATKTGSTDTLIKSGFIDADEEVVVGPNFKFTGVDYPLEVSGGELIICTVHVLNDGDEPGTTWLLADIVVDGVVVKNLPDEEVTLLPNEEISVDFQISAEMVTFQFCCDFPQ
jgi:PKD repeat protein